MIQCVVHVCEQHVWQMHISMIEWTEFALEKSHSENH